MVRFFAARCIGTLSMHQVDLVLEFITHSVLPKLTDQSMDISHLQGPIETVYRKIPSRILFLCISSTSLQM